MNGKFYFQVHKRDNKFYNENNERKMKNFAIIRSIERLFYTREFVYEIKGTWNVETVKSARRIFEK